MKSVKCPLCGKRQRGKWHRCNGGEFRWPGGGPPGPRTQCIVHYYPGKIDARVFPATQQFTRVRRASR